jgi:exoribonuclease R
MPSIPDAQFAELLATGRSHAEVAEVLGCSRSTITRRLRNNPELANLILERRGEYLSEISGLLIASVFNAHRTLDDLVRPDSTASDSAKLTAAKILLAECRSYSDATGIDHRLRELEKELTSRKKRDAQFQPRAVAS